MNRQDRFEGIEKKTTRFIVGAGIALLALLVIVAIKQDYFSQTTSVYFFAPDARGLNKGMAVKFIGFKVGRVEEIAMEPNTTVKVRLSLNNQYLQYIGQDAKARLVKESLVGESIVEIVPGRATSRQVAQNGVLTFERGKDIAELAETLVGQLQPILADIKKITGTVGDSDADIRQSLKNINAVSAGLVDTTQQMNRLAQDGRHSLGLVNQSLPGLLQKTDASLDNIQGSTADVRKVMSESAPLLPQIVRNGDRVLQDGQEIVTGVKGAWPIRTLLSPPQDALLPLEGDVAPERQEGAK